MIYIYDTSISEKKRIDLSLVECYGIGKYISRCFFSKLGFNKKSKQIGLNIKLKNNTEKVIIKYIENIYFFSIELKARNFMISKFKEIKLLKNLVSLKHFFKLPVRGQRTKNNAQTQKKKRPNWRRIPIPKSKKN